MNNSQGRSGRSSPRGRGRGPSNYFSNRLDTCPICQVCHKPGHLANFCYHWFNRKYQAFLHLPIFWPTWLPWIHNPTSPPNKTLGSSMQELLIPSLPISITPMWTLYHIMVLTKWAMEMDPLYWFIIRVLLNFVLLRVIFFSPTYFMFY